MIQRILVTLFFLSSTLCCAQHLDVKFLEQASRISFLDIDSFMEDGHGFIKGPVEENGNSRTYRKTLRNDFNNMIYVTVLSTRGSHSLQIFLGKNYDIREIKNNILDYGYHFEGTNELNYLVYKKDELAFIISQELSSSGTHELLVLPVK